MKPLAKITENIVEKSISRLGAIQTHIFLNWQDIAGQYANLTFPEKIRLSKNKNSEGLIIIKVQNGFGPEIQLAIPFLLNQINARYGFKAISKIKIIQTNLGYKQPDKEFSSKDKIEENTENLISNILPDGEIKLAMQKLELSRKKNRLD
ncbi:DciA family protein [Alphaproteobacteria bacterium]|jgi:hypothetical protein|nr:DciA family protein [Alphaproteobacteria bacterium]|tara:strand:+ start:82 stop:531 length:450 start_codon:yes stop_codon:yes gene_type:complete